ncbi:MAG: NADH-quinone oxidoreductase subunit L [Deltaproteobacteria bacterium]|jgi:NADH-quinone oxidoreductase subunit L|nr:NADH-quinone oxidoreductase subunit L [Deltaproteobacteria bacterium]
MTPIEYALIALFVPLAAAFIIAVVAPLRYAGMPAALLSVAAALVSLGASLALLVQQIAQPDRVIHEVVRWLPNGPAALAQVGVHLDGTSVSMSVVVTLVAACVQIFSLGYMADEPPAARGRYFGYHSFFIFTMLLLVIAPNMLQLFAGWELVGLTSYLLIGFYFQKPSAAKASVKAIWVTKFADIGLLLGLICLFAVTGGFEWTATLSKGWATAITLLMFLAVVGKSAQFPLHIWLPNAMEGPTPVSALLHAATMVAAGVYLVVRADPLFAQAPTTQLVMAWIGGFTALFAAVIATVQTDIKRVLAYSTCSQLGYMVCALGAGASMAGYFHLTTHAFFKALLFLAAGSMIHAVHSNEMSAMGGLGRRMKATSTVFIVGALALAGIPGFAGFFSKDLILEAVHEAGMFVPWLMLIAAAFLTAFYMGRAVFLSIFGPFSPTSEGAHESGFSMTGPLWLLAAGAVGIGYFGSDFAALAGGTYHFHLGMSGILGTTCALIGLLLSWLIYGSHRLSPQAFRFVAPIAWLARSGLVDRFFEFAYRRGALVLADAVGFFDRYVIDGVMNWIGWSTITSGRWLRRIQTGNVRDYVYAVVAGAVVIVFWGLSR